MKRLAFCVVALALLVAGAGAEEVWEKSLGEEITAVATDEYGDRIFVGTESGKLYCYDAGGSVVWSQTLVGEVVALEVDGAADYLLVEIGDGTRIESRNPETGALKWEYPLSTPKYMTLSQGGISQCLLGSSHDWLRMYDGAGTPIYHQSIGATTDLAISGDASWFVGGSGSDLKAYALNVPDSGSWIAPMGAHPVNYPWAKRVAHTITGTTSSLTNYPIEITVIRGAGSSSGSTLYAPDCRADFADIRFTAADGVTHIPYHLESVSGSTATFLVNVPSIPASPATATIYVYWSNSAATTTSDPDAARYTLDDFSGTSLNTDIWETFGTATITVADGKLTITGDNIGYSGVRSKGMYTGANDTIEVNANVEGTLGDNGAFWIGFFGDGQVPNSINAELAVTLKRATFTSWNSPQQLHGSTANGSAWANYLFGARLTGYNDYRVEWNGTSADMQAGAYGEQTLANAPTTNSTIMLAIGDTHVGYGGVTMTVDSVTIVSPVNIPALHGAWGPVESTVTPQDTKTLDGTIIDIDAPETGDWVAVSTTTKTYIIQITDSGFGTVYSADRTGTPYQIAVADGGSFAIEGRSILSDIFRIDAVQVGTYTTGGAVQHVALAQKNGLYAAAGSDDGKYYIFSKDESSSWYLVHASDSYDPVTALAMSWRGEITVIGRADGSLTVYENEGAGGEEIYLTFYILKDGSPYINKSVTVASGVFEDGDPETWTTQYTSTTDGEGKFTILATPGTFYRININEGEKIVVIQATTATPIHTIVFRSTLIHEKYSYNVQYNATAGTIEMSYEDNEDVADVTWTIVRTDTYEEVFTDTIPSSTLATTSWTVSDSDITYKVNAQVSRSGGAVRNTWFINPQNASPISLPFWDENIQNAVFIVFLMVLGGIFYFSTGAKGAIVVAIIAALFRYFSWITVPWFWVIAALVFAFIANLAEGA